MTAYSASLPRFLTEKMYSYPTYKETLANYLKLKYHPRWYDSYANLFYCPSSKARPSEDEFCSFYSYSKTDSYRTFEKIEKAFLDVGITPPGDEPANISEKDCKPFFKSKILKAFSARNEKILKKAVSFYVESNIENFFNFFRFPSLCMNRSWSFNRKLSVIAPFICQDAYLYTLKNSNKQKSFSFQGLAFALAREYLRESLELIECLASLLTSYIPSKAWKPFIIAIDSTLRIIYTKDWTDEEFTKFVMMREVKSDLFPDYDLSLSLNHTIRDHIFDFFFSAIEQSLVSVILKALNWQLLSFRLNHPNAWSSYRRSLCVFNDLMQFQVNSILRYVTKQIVFHDDLEFPGEHYSSFLLSQ